MNRKFLSAIGLIGIFALSGCGGTDQGIPRHADTNMSAPGDATTATGVSGQPKDAAGGLDHISDTASATAVGPSFNCQAELNSVEAMICQSRDLSRLDRDIASAYAKAFKRANPTQKRAMQQLQKSFLADRNNCRTKQCLDEILTARLDGLVDASEASPAAKDAGGGTSKLFKTSYNCQGKLTSVEDMICHDEELASYDVSVTNAYNAMKKKLLSHGKEALLEDQQAYLAKRNACTDESCVFETQIARLRELDSN